MIRVISGFITAIISVSILYFLVYKPNATEINNLFKRDSIEKTTDAKSKTDKRKNKERRKRPTVTDSKVGKVLDQYKGVDIYYNGLVKNVSGRNTTSDGYNLGLKYQCVEFVKRFYYEVYNHKMPNSYGHAREFFNQTLSDGDFNNERAMFQFNNQSSEKPQVDDLLVFGAAPFNKFGHVAVVSKVASDHIEIAQQNPGKGNPSRSKYGLSQNSGKWVVDNEYVDGWLRMP